MIKESNAYSFCMEDISLIDNYDVAISDVNQIYDCHHKDEIRVLPSGMIALRSSEELMENKRYYNCPANELIFIPHGEHTKLHNMYRTHTINAMISKSLKGRTLSDSHRAKLREAWVRRKMAGLY